MRARLSRTLGLFAFVLAVSQLPASALETHLVGIYQGSPLSNDVEGLRIGGYELSNGTWVSFDKWYHSDWTDMRFEMLTQFSDRFGILWGASTGQRAEKVRIKPSLLLGFILQRHPTPSTTFSLTLRSILGGNLTESPCIADYGAIGGIQTVNCRLAASTLPPPETLKYLKRDAPARLSVSVRFKVNF
jgi:hypothetical protein